MNRCLPRAACSLWLVLAACGGTTSPSSPSSSTAGAEPGAADWIALAAQIADISVTAIEEALSVAAPQGLRFLAAARPLDLTAPLIPLNWSTTYACCGSVVSGASSLVRIDGQIVLAVDDTNAIDVTETISGSSVRWGFGTTTNSSVQLRLPADALRVSAKLVVRDGVVQPIQQIRVVGTLTYIDSSFRERTASVDLFLGYRRFPDDPSATGRFGEAQFNGEVLPVPPAATPSAPVQVMSNLEGGFGGRLAITVRSGLVGPAPPTSCVEFRQLSGRVRVSLLYRPDGSVSGSADVTGTDNFSGGCGGGGGRPISWNQVPVSGVPDSFGFREEQVSGSVTNRLQFSAGTRGIGTLVFSTTSFSANVSSSGSVSISVGLQ